MDNIFFPAAAFNYLLFEERVFENSDFFYLIMALQRHSTSFIYLQIILLLHRHRAENNHCTDENRTHTPSVRSTPTQRRLSLGHPGSENRCSCIKQFRFMNIVKAELRKNHQYDEIIKIGRRCS